MFKFKKAGIMLLCLSMVAGSLAACGGGDVGGEEKTNATNHTGTADTNRVVEKVTDENCEIVTSENGEAVTVVVEGEQEPAKETIYTKYDNLVKVGTPENGYVPFMIYKATSAMHYGSAGSWTGDYYYGFADMEGQEIIEPTYDCAPEAALPDFSYNYLKVPSLIMSKTKASIIDREGNVKFKEGENGVNLIGQVSEGYFWVETFEESLAGMAYTVTYYSAKDMKAVATFENARAIRDGSGFGGLNSKILPDGSALLIKGNDLPNSLSDEKKLTINIGDYDKSFVAAQNEKWTLDLDTVKAFEVAYSKGVQTVGTDKDGKLLGTVLLMNNSGTKYYAVVDNAGNVLLDAQTKIIFAKNGKFQNGLCVAKDAESGFVGFINAKGEWVIQAQFTSATSFNKEGYAVVNDIAVIDETGKLVLAPAGYSIEMVTSLQGEYIYRYPNGNKIYLTFDGDTVKYEERAVLTSSWESTYVIKGGQIMFEGSVGYTTVLTRGTWYSFSKLDNTITIDGKEFTLQEVETSAE